MYCHKYLEYIDTYKLLDQLSALRVTVYSEGLSDTADGYCVLSINFKERIVSFRTYLYEEESKAANIFAQLEQTIDSDEAVLLVSLAKMREIREAYPSYFLDTKEFLAALSDFNQSCLIFKK